MKELASSAWQRINGLKPFPQPPLIRTRYPIVLMHGFGIFASLRRGGHLHEEAMHLRSHGVMAYAPNVAAYNTVDVRSQMWKKRLEHVLDETGADRLNLVAQSMGGLDARYLITKLGMHDRIASLVTIATPHRGSGVADIVLERPDWVRRWTAAVLNWMGATSLEDATADFLRSVAELTPRHIESEFNPAVPNHPDVRYLSFGGQAGRGTSVAINPVLRVLNGLLYSREGINDGFVSVDSSVWGEFLGAVDADHAAQVGLNFAGGDFDADAFYRRIAALLAAEGF